MKLILVLLVALASPVRAAQSYNCLFTSQADVSASTVSVRVLPKRSARRCLIIQNKGSSTIYIKADSAHTSTENMQLASGASWEPIIIPVNSIYIRSAAGVVTTTVLEGQ